MTASPVFKKVLIANRGEIAVRVMHTLMQMGIETVAIYNRHDAHSMHVRTAHQAVLLEQGDSGSTLGETYLNQRRILEIAKDVGAEAIHPGYGFLSENSTFATACAQAGIVFIGPTPEVIASMGDKVVAKATMEKAGVPTLPGWTAPETMDKDLPAAVLKEAQQAAKNMGYPVLVKAAAGGGGKGMRLVETPDKLEAALKSAASEALNAFGDARVFLEKYIARSRHVEVQILGDTHGNVVHLFERECSIQRRHQKIIEEAPCAAQALTPEIRQKLLDAAVAAGKAVGYTNAGTVEFLFDDATSQFYFLEMNTRLQVEHPVTELIVGRDLVREQIRVAAGLPFSFAQQDLQARGHAIECRICAEDPAKNFMPSIGTVTHLSLPHSPFVRLDSGLETGDEVSVYFDPMLAKLVVWGETREAALARMDWALARLVILGVTHNGPYLRRILQHPAFQAAQLHTHFLQEHQLLTTATSDHPSLTTQPDLPEDTLWQMVAVLTQLSGLESKSQGVSEALSSDEDILESRKSQAWALVGAWRN